MSTLMNPNFVMYWAVRTRPPVLFVDGMYVSPCINCSHPIYRLTDVAQLACDNEECQAAIDDWLRPD